MGIAKLPELLGAPPRPRPGRSDKSRTARLYRARKAIRRAQIPGPQAPGSPIAKAAGLSRQTVYRILDNPAACEASLTAWGI
jgi:hypothetical protein